MKYLLYLILNGGSDKDDDRAVGEEEVRYLEFVYPGENEDDLIRKYSEKPSPRVFTTHLPPRLLRTQIFEDKVKVVVVIRNPKDTLVSLYHFYRMMSTLGNFDGTWDEFFELMKVKPCYEDIFDCIVEWWKVRDLENVLVVRYEEMKEDLTGVVRKVAEFTGFELSDDTVQNIVRLGNFELMKNNPRVNVIKSAKIGVCDFTKSKWLRKGEIGDWVNYFSEEQSKFIDAKCEEKCKPLGLTFQWHGQNGKQNGMENGNW